MLQPLLEAPAVQKAKMLGYFLIFWAVLNAIQALTTGMHPDEAYYWVYAQFLDWGYFDHPPMVALYIWLGGLLSDNALAVRLVGVITNTASIYFLWLVVKRYVAQPGLFVLLFASVLIFHVYAFAITPDAPLFFFTTLFLLLYRRYLERDGLMQAVWLGLACAGLLLSKYHGVLVIFFVLLSNLKLLQRKSFWLVTAIALAAFLPHLYWQYLHGFPSLHYHLFDRSATPYRFEYTAQYFLDQALMMGPLVGWLLIYTAIKQKSTDDFLRGLKFILFGVLIFFFFSTFKGRVQAHWPLIQFIPMFVLAYIYLASEGRTLVKRFKWLFIVNISLILLARLVLMHTPELLKQNKFLGLYNDHDTWAQDIKAVAGDSKVVFVDGFQQPSFYNYYTRSLNGLGYNSVHYRKTQYDLWPIADSAMHQRVLLITNHVVDSAAAYEPISTAKGDIYGTWIDDFSYFPKVEFTPQDYSPNWQPGEVREIAFTVLNGGDHSLELPSSEHTLHYAVLKDGRVLEYQQIERHASFSLEPGAQKPLRLTVAAPAEAGAYKFVISVQPPLLYGTRNSRYIQMQVE